MAEDNLEVEVTIDLNKEGYETFCAAMNSSLIDIYDQWNVFFDTVDHSLIKSNKRCRVRSIDAQNSENQYTICSKSGKSDVIDGHQISKKNYLNLKILNFVFLLIFDLLEEYINLVNLISNQTNARYQMIRNFTNLRLKAANLKKQRGNWNKN